jgi:uncharacterized protein YyaL (SSP411 family)
MHHNPAKNVLHIPATLEAVAAKTGQPIEAIKSLIDSVRAKLLDARSQRPTPFIDRTLYTGWNAMAVTAYLETARVLRLDSARDFALLTLDRLLSEAWDGAAALHHVIAYGETSSAVSVPAASSIPGNLDDYAFTVHACIDAWLATGSVRYFLAAEKLADAMIARFYDKAVGAFFDTPAPKDDQLPIGALTARRKPLQDSPTPAGNPTAASALLRLEPLNGRKEYREIAEDTLGSFSGIVEHFGLYAGSYGLALERLLLDPMQIVIVGSGPQADALEATAISGFAVNKTVIRLPREKLAAGKIPGALAETLLNVPAPSGSEAFALVCRARTCLPPVTTPDALLEALRRPT